MVVGNDAIALRFSEYKIQNKYLFFSDGVLEHSRNENTILKEQQTLLKELIQKNPEKTIIYFSSCTLQNKALHENIFCAHKLRMEETVTSLSKEFVIFRLPETTAYETGSLFHKIGEAIRMRKEVKFKVPENINLTDPDEIYIAVSQCILEESLRNKTINIANPHLISVSEIVKLFEKFFLKKSRCQFTFQKNKYHADLREIQELFQKRKILFEPETAKIALDKYCKHLIAKKPLLSVIVPTYNEEHGIREFYDRTKNVLNILATRFDHEMIFVNDYSSDTTLSKLNELATQDKKVKVISFSRNFGNQMGITAGIDFAKGDLAIIIDDDLQDPPEIILNFIALWYKGYKVVYGLRPKRKGVNFFFRILARIYYRIIGVLSETKIPNDTGDFRLIDKVVISTLKQMKEENRYYRGMVAWVGFPQIGCLYERDKRFAGVSTFSFAKYMRFAVNGLTSFTDKPLYFSSFLGLIVTGVSFALAIVFAIWRIVDPSFTIPGWTSLSILILFFGGIQLLSIGILSIYISKIYREVKGRPLYIIESKENLD